MIKGPFYILAVSIARFLLFLWHPIFRVIGREHVIRDSRCMICGNHSGMADPIWMVFAMRLGHVPRVMAKKELMDTPVIGWFLSKLNVIGVDRGGNDVKAIKAGLRALQDDQQMLVFPEGTRVKKGKVIEPKRGALVMAHRTHTPILPVYLTTKRFPWSPMTCVIGEPYHLPEDRKLTDADFEQATAELMEKIYALGEQA